MANPNKTVYKCYPSTGTGIINTGTTLQVNFDAMRVAVSGYVKNLNSQSGDLTITLNLSTNDSIFIAAGETFEFENEYITKIFITNASGVAITYQVVIIGG